MILTPKNAKIYDCKVCDFSCSKESEWKRHNITRKHINRTKLNDLDPINPIDPVTIFQCECGRSYSARNSLWYHKKKCSMTQGENTNNTSINYTTPNHNNKTNSKSGGVEIDKEMLITMLLKNQEVMEKMMEIMPVLGSNYNTITNTNSHNTTNNQFNIQMFLNEHCKNAMNLTDFIDTLPITAETYDSTIDNGLTKTITNMITNGLSQLDVLERPIHCTDATRKILYVKEDNVWEKDNELVRILSGIRNIASKQRTLINKWRDVNHGWEINDKIQTRFTNLICNSMNDIENDAKETNKIIRSLSKTVYLDNGTRNHFLE